jgi:hypothetical protein
MIALLGFAGCDLYTGESIVSFTLRVPADLPIVEARFIWFEPGSTTIHDVNQLSERLADPSTRVLSTGVPDPSTGIWSVLCRVRVEGASGEVMRQTSGSFFADNDLLSETAGELRWETYGRPATNDFQLQFVGFNES